MPSGSLGVATMNGFTFTVILLCFAFSAAAEEALQEGGSTVAPPAEEVARRELTDEGYVIRYNNVPYNYPLQGFPEFVREEKNPIETNVIETEKEDGRRPLFYFTTYEAVEDSPEKRKLPKSGPYIEIRKKRNAIGEDVPESSKVGKLRRKRTYCGKCGGHGGYGGYGGHGGYGVAYVPVTYSVYPVYGGGGGKGCHSCGGGYGGGGYGGGGGGSFSYSSSSAQSSAGSFGWGK